MSSVMSPVIIHADSFGSAVACILGAHGFTALPFEEASAFDWTERRPAFVGVVLGHTRPAALTALAERLWEASLPHGVILLSDVRLMCGPLVLPPRGPCVSCMLKRTLSLTELPRTARMELSFQQHLERSTVSELRGYLPTLVMMAVLRLRLQATRDPVLASTLCAINFVNNSSVETPVTPLHACRCRGKDRSEGGGRWAASIERCLAGIDPQ